MAYKIVIIVNSRYRERPATDLYNFLLPTRLP
jgi:hypothetical protein